MYLSIFGFPQMLFIINTPKGVGTAKGTQHFLTSSIYLTQNWKDFEGNNNNSESRVWPPVTHWLYLLIPSVIRNLRLLILPLCAALGLSCSCATCLFLLLVVFVLNTEAFLKILKRAYKHATIPKKSSMAQ